MTWLTSRRGVTVLGSLAFLGFIERMMLDFRFVFSEFIPDSDIGTMALTMAFYVLASAAWLWALFAAAADRRRGLWTLVGLATLMLVGLGVGTLVSFCPSPCETAWPLGEVSNWIGLVVGVAAVAAVGLRLRQPAGG